MKGLVIKSTGSWYHVKTEDEEIYPCKIKGKFRLKGIRTTNPVAVGDIVYLKFATNTDYPVIYKIEERKNYIIRKSVNLSKEAHILATNVDQAILFVTLAFPTTSLSFIDRFLISAKAYHIPCTIVFNKVDLYDDDMLEDLEAFKMMYESLGYSCLVASATESLGLKDIEACLKGKISMISGHSGVGKSTLINALDESLDITTSEISDVHLQGRHTTTFAEMHDLHFGASIIDTPGVRGFGLIYFSKEELKGLFSEFLPYAADCKFNNCIHLNEPKCAVKKAVENGELFETRYENYIQFMKDVDEENINNYR